MSRGLALDMTTGRIIYLALGTGDETKVPLGTQNVLSGGAPFPGGWDPLGNDTSGYRFGSELYPSPMMGSDWPQLPASVLEIWEGMGWECFAALTCKLLLAQE